MFSLLIAASALVPQVDVTNIIPKPSSLRVTDEGSEAFLDTRNLTIYADDESRSVALLFAKTLNKDGLHARVTKQVSEADIFFSMQLSTAIPESYSLGTGRKSLKLLANDNAGLFYGTQTLRQILESRSPGEIALPGFIIRDQPRFSWRGMHLDCSRHFFTVPEIKDYIDQLARYKMNVFHWHLVDDGGWRMEVKKYPKLTSVGAWRTDQSPEIWNYGNLEFPGPTSGKKLYGGFYTQRQIRDIVKYAQDRMITTVPEIELPGHCIPAVVAYPEVTCSVDKLPTRSYRTGAYCPGKEQTFKFLQDVLDETMALFPSKTIHIGGDEVDKFDWERCPDCAARMKSESLKDSGELQSYFVKRIEKYLNSKGRSLMGWDEILEGGLAPNAEVMSWRGTEGGIAAAKQGHRVVMTPTSDCYFDYSYESISTERVYNYEPVPAELTEAEGKFVLGAQGNVWTEWMPTYAKVQQMIFPRMLAMSETLWTPKAGRDYADFQRRLAPAYGRFVKEGTSFYSEPPSAEYTLMVMDTRADVSFVVPPIPGLTMRYTTDGSAPTAQSALYTGPITVTKPCVVRAGTFMGSKDLNQPVQVICRRPVESTARMQGIHYTASAAQQFDILPDFAKLTATEQGDATDFSIDRWRARPTFAVEFRAFITVKTAGTYDFHLLSDDGSALLIDDAMVVNHDGPHAPSTKSGKAYLQPGRYAITLRYFQGGGASALTPTVTTPDGELPLEKLVSGL